MKIEVRSLMTTLRIDEDQNHVTSTSTFAEKLLGMRKNSSGILPPAVRWLAKDGNSVMAERPPFLLEMVNGRPIFIPWTVYAIDFSEHFRQINYFGVYTRPEQIYTFNDELFRLPFGHYGPEHQLTNILAHELQNFNLNAFSTELISPFSQILARYSHNYAQVTLAEAIMSVVAYFWGVVAHSANVSSTLPCPDVEHMYLPDRIRGATYSESFARWETLNYDELPLLATSALTTVQTVANTLAQRARERFEPSLEQRLLKMFESDDEQGL